MEITMALLADAANISREGKLNVLGAFTNINTQGFPARHPSMQLVLEFEMSRSEVGQHKRIEVRLLDEDGTQLGGLHADFTVPDPERPALRFNVGAVLPLTDVVFQKEGTHMFDVLIDGDSRKQLHLTITPVDGGDGA